MRALTLVVLACLVGWGAATPCSPSRTNENCIVKIDGTKPVSPLPIRVRPGNTVTVEVEKKKLVETLSLDLEVKESDTPDPLSAILNLLIPRIEKFVWEIQLNNNLNVLEGSPEFAKLSEFEKLAARATNLLVMLQSEYDVLWNFLNEDKKGARVLLNHIRRYPADGGCSESTFESAHLKPFFKKTENAEKAHALDDGRSLDELMIAAAAEYRRLVSQSRTDEADLARYRKTLDALDTARSLLAERKKATHQQLSAVYEARRILDSNKKNMKCSQPETIAEYPGQHLGQTAVAKVNLIDSVTGTKKQIATVTVVWGSTKWEVSGGVAISGLVEPTFAFVPTLSATGGDVSASKTLTLTRTAKYPAMVPLALAHYRISEFICKARRCAMLASFGLGANPSSGSADGFGGCSFSFRNAVFSALWQRGRVNGLPPPLAVGNTAQSALTIPAVRAWKNSFAIGLTVRLPIN